MAERRGAFSWPVHCACPRWTRQYNQVALYAKIHHALIDGGAGVALSKIVPDLVPDPAPREAAGAAATPISLPRTGSADFGSVLVDRALTQMETGLKVAAAMPAMAKAAADSLPGLLDPHKLKQLPQMVPPSTPLNTAISCERSSGTSTLLLKKVKAVAKAAGSEANDVILAVSAGALRRWLQEQDALPDKPLSAAVPVSLREEGNADTNNQAFAMTCRIATDVADPEGRLARVIEASGEAKAMISPLKDFLPHVQNASTPGMPIAMQVLALLYGRSGLSNVLPPTANVIIQCDHVECAGPAGAAVCSRGADAGSVAGVDCRPRHGPEHHRPELYGQDGGRPDRGCQCPARRAAPG